MKRIAVSVLLVCFLFGCSYGTDPLERPLKFREALNNASEVEFKAKVTADYFEELYTFEMDCAVDELGELSFRVCAPQTIAGITGFISDELNLTFDDTVLALKPVDGDQASPIMAPWLLIKALKSGYIYACTALDSGYCVSVRDSYEDDAMLLEVKFDEYDNPLFAEFFCNDRRILCIELEAFQLR